MLMPNLTGAQIKIKEASALREMERVQVEKEDSAAPEVVETKFTTAMVRKVAKAGRA